MTFKIKEQQIPDCYSRQSLRFNYDPSQEEDLIDFSYYPDIAKSEESIEEAVAKSEEKEKEQEKEKYLPTSSEKWKNVVVALFVLIAAIAIGICIFVMIKMR